LEVAKNGYFQGFFALFELFQNLLHREKQGKLGIKNAHKFPFDKAERISLRFRHYLFNQRLPLSLEIHEQCHLDKNKLSLSKII